MMNLDIKTKIAILKLHLSIAFVDNEYSEEEENLIKKLCNKFQIDFKTRVKITKEISTTKMTMPQICRQELKNIKTKSLQKECLKSLAAVCAADFILYEDELMLLQLIAEEWGMFIKELNEKD